MGHHARFSHEVEQKARQRITLLLTGKWQRHTYQESAVAFWLFKCQPKEYRLDDRLADPNNTITWTVKRHRDKIQLNDVVFLWAGGKNTGIRAVMVVAELPKEMAELENEQQYWAKKDASVSCRVVGRLTHRVNLPADTLRNEGVLEDLPVKPGTQGTNFRVTDSAGAVLMRLLQEHRVDGAADNESGLGHLPVGNASPTRAQTLTNRIVRDTEVGAAVKRLHDFRCQVCGLRLETPDGPYAEAAHIHPLGGEHSGPDVPENVLCLCPNHHVLFDAGAFSVADDMSLLGMEGQCRVVPDHTIDLEQCAYHRQKVYHRQS